MKSWLINPREPLNTRIWGEIASEVTKSSLIFGSAWISVTREGKKARIRLVESDLGEIQSDDAGPSGSRAVVE